LLLEKGDRVMSARCELTINGKSIEANPGETLIDAALGAWLLIPHDCRSGQCESCRVTVVSGDVDDNGTRIGHTVLACQTTVSGSASIRFEELPAPVKRAGLVTECRLLSPEIAEVVVTTDRVLDYRPGQYVRLKFAGFPAREYSPTCRLVDETDPSELVFHIRLLPDGQVSSQIGTGIKPGHRVHVQGPFGNAYLREGNGPLVLVAGGTGWAPVWSVARAARTTQPDRHLVVIAGSRDAENLYMKPALNWLMDDGVREVFATAEIGATHPILSGRPSHYLPLLSMEDTVYVAGPSGLVDVVKHKARTASAQCYADPFLPSVQKASMFDRVRRVFGAGTSAPPLAMATR
jgi:3-phenylpropionate/trans-cinnamate dioxygenase ferredoxin reductase subunit